MAVNTELVEEISPSIRVLRDQVEYHWYVGCTPTALAMVLGYWDRHGYENLIDGDSSTYNDAVQRAMASEGHLAEIYNPDGYYEVIPDLSEAGVWLHKSDSIADFALSSRSVYGLGDGWSFYGYEGIGIHGYAAYRGYDDFVTTHEGWGQFTFNQIAAEIDAGRPVVLSVDSNADGRNDHNVVVFGYDSAALDLLIHDGWERTSDTRWIDFTGARSGHEFGITSATFVLPGDDGHDGANVFALVNDGFGTLASARATLEGASFDIDTLASNSGLSLSRTVAVASADGHTFYQLYNDSSGSAALYESFSYGDGEFRSLLMSSNSGLSATRTLGLATSDARTFYQLYDDGSGTAAIYETTLSPDGTFSYTLRNANSGLSLSTLAFSTTDGETFYTLVDDGSGTAASYEAVLDIDWTFDLTLLASNSGFSRATVDFVAWETREIFVPAPGEFYDDPGATQVIVGDTNADVFILTGAEAGYGWSLTEDGGGFVVWSQTSYDLLYGVETLRFTDAEVVLPVLDGSGDLTVVDDAARNERLFGTAAGTDTFVLAGSVSQYGWSDTDDGTGKVIWVNATGAYDILIDFDRFEFADGFVDLSTGNLTAFDDPAANQYVEAYGADDVFIFASDSSNHGWAPTDDGRGTVIWDDAGNYDILVGFERAQFADTTIFIA